MGTKTALGSVRASRSWDDLTIANDFVFCKVMLNEILCCEVLEAVLGVSIDHVEHVGRQEVLDAGVGSKSVRLDVYVRSEAGPTFDVEMQACDTHELPQRARYYQALMALDQIERGQAYRDLRDEVGRVLDNEDWRLEYMKLEVRDQLNVEKGREEGRAEGIAEGDERTARLIKTLLSQGCTDDVDRALVDADYRKELCRELGIH